MNSKFDPIGTNEIGSADNVQQKRKAGIFFRFDEKRWEILTFKTYYRDSTTIKEDWELYRWDKKNKRFCFESFPSDDDGLDNPMIEEGYKWHDEKKCWYFGPDDSDFDLLGPPAQLEFMRLNRFGWDPVNEFWYHWDTRLLEFIVRFHGKYPSWYWSGKKELTFDEAEDVVLLDELNILFGRRMRRKKQEGNRVTYTGLWYYNECAELMRWFIKYINYLESLIPPCNHEALKKYCGGEVRIGQKIFYTQARKEGTVLSAFFREALGKKIPHIVLRVNGKYMSYSGTDYCSVTMSGSKRRPDDEPFRPAKRFNPRHVPSAGDIYERKERVGEDCRWVVKAGGRRCCIDPSVADKMPAGHRVKVTRTDVDGLQFESVEETGPVAYKASNLQFHKFMRYVPELQKRREELRDEMYRLNYFDPLGGLIVAEKFGEDGVKELKFWMDRFDKAEIQYTCNWKEGDEWKEGEEFPYLDFATNFLEEEK